MICVYCYGYVLFEGFNKMPFSSWFSCSSRCDHLVLSIAENKSLWVLVLAYQWISDKPLSVREVTIAP